MIGTASTKVLFSVIGVIMMIPQCAFGAGPSTDELLTAKRWAAAVFEGRSESIAPRVGLDVAANWGRVQKNGRYGRPLRMAGAEYARGLFCHAPSEIRVRLPGPGKAFTAMIGVDDALQWDVRDYPSGPLWPEVFFSVRVGGKEIFKSEVIKNGMVGTPITVDLGGAREFTIEVSGARRTPPPVLGAVKQKKAARQARASEICEWGEADWADAMVTLSDGRNVYLDDLPMVGELVQSESGGPPFSFVYDGEPSSSLLSAWKQDRRSRRLDADRTQHVLTYSDPETGLQVQCVGVEYSSFPTVEWTLHFKNTGTKDSAILEKIRALDIRLKRGPDSEFLLHHSLGSSCRFDDYRPIETPLEPQMTRRFAPVTGFSSDPDMPYFNVESGTGDGMILAVGWPGQWATEFSRDDGDGLSIAAGQEMTHLRLHPGEEIRSPLIVLQFWQGDWIHSQNVWRRWMVAHNMPSPGGKLPEPILAGCSFGATGFEGVTEQNQKEFIARYEEEKLGINWWWMDYGWHVLGAEAAPTSAWEPSKKRFPNGLRPVSDDAHSKGMKALAWFTPEYSLFGGHSEWLIKGIMVEPLGRGGEQALLDFGNPDARRWITDVIDKVITEGALDCYRHDSGMGPLPSWRAAEPADRQGIREIRYVEGFLEFYDELLRRHPNLQIDNCCRGGRRNDVETMRRSIPLTRTDFYDHIQSEQSQTQGIALWLPFFGSINDHPDDYGFRSLMCPSMTLLYNMTDMSLDYANLRRLHAQFREVAPNYYGDFYPLTPYSPDDGAWMARQWDRPEAGTGFVQVFHRPGRPHGQTYTDTLYVRLQGLEPNTSYDLRSIDEAASTRYAGRDLMDKGIRVQAAEQAALILVYRRVE